MGCIFLRDYASLGKEGSKGSFIIKNTVCSLKGGEQHRERNATDWGG